MRLPVRTTLLQNSAALMAARICVRLPVRTTLLQNTIRASDNYPKCDYQSERHCSKTNCLQKAAQNGAITSQNDTAPKHMTSLRKTQLSAITSQNDTAPKPRCFIVAYSIGAITSQNDTAPKRAVCGECVLVSAITSQNDTAPKPLAQDPHCKGRSFLTGSIP